MRGSTGLLTGTDTKPMHPDNVPSKLQVLESLDMPGAPVNGLVIIRVRTTYNISRKRIVTRSGYLYIGL